MNASCTYGFLYSDTVEPLTEDMRNTPNTGDLASGTNFMLSEPITAPGIRVEWASRGIGDIGKKAGFEKVEYADLHTFSILGGLYRTKKVMVYGKKFTEPHATSPD